jgi:phosphoribosylaminoimidazolecarboxamide formyltransferase/IMP cyclohydrolase
MSKKIIPKTAFLSVSDKSGLVPFARFLKNKKVKIIATGGTVRALKKAGIPAVSIASITGFPEIFGGRVKSIHPKIAGGILGERDIHNDEAKKNGIEWIDLVVCNLYPFKRVAKTLGASLKEKIENIDVGGPTMIRSAAKNNKWVSVVVDPGDYGVLKKAISAGGVDERMRLSLASKAFNYCANYDLAIATELESSLETDGGAISLRYGENPHQKAFVIKEARGSAGVPQAKQLQGKELSYNNFLDSEAALLCLHEFKGSSCVIVKHGSPCGIGFGETTSSFMCSFTNPVLEDAP